MPDKPLKEVLGSRSALGNHRVLGVQAEEFLNNGEGDTREFRASVSRFLESLAREGAKPVADLLVAVTAVLSRGGPDILTTPIPNPVIGEAETLLPTDPTLKAAWLEVERWTEASIRRGWSQTKRERIPLWFMRACLELARRFTIAASDPRDPAAALAFVAERGWEGWSLMLPTLPPEKVWLKFAGEWTRGPDQPRSEFVQRVLGHVADEIISQLNLEASNEWLAEAALAPRPEKRARSRGIKPDSRTEGILARRILGLKDPADIAAHDPGDWRERCERTGERLGLLVAKS